MTHVLTLYDDAFVVILTIDWFNMNRILVNERSSTNIPFLDAFENMGNNNKKLNKVDLPLIEL